MAAQFASSYQTKYHQEPIQTFIRCSTAEAPCPEALGYTQGKTLGSGTYAKVKAAWSPYEGKMIAIKNLHKKAASKDYLSKFLPREIEVLQLVNHPNILQVYKIIETDEKCYFMLEIAENGDLLDYINSRGRVPEDEARYIFKQMTSAIDFCHSIGVVHRDLKCENIMISRDMQVKVGDFGFAVHTESPVSTPCGSYSYAAPELFTSEGKGYDGKKADVWSLGVILYAMVCGRLPFGDDSQVKRNAQRVLTFGRHISSECKSLLRAVLNVSPAERYSCADILKHSWTCGNTRSPSILQCRPKYTLDGCLPIIHQQMQQQMQVDTIPYPTIPSVPVRGHSARVAQMRSAGSSRATAPGPSRAATAPRTIRIDAHATAQTVTHTGNPIPPPPRAQQLRQKPLVAKIGAAGRKLADAMRHVGQGSRGQLLENQGSNGQRK